MKRASATIPGLARKVAILRDATDPPMSVDAMLRRLGIGSESTLRWYASGSATRPAGKVPSEVHERLVEVAATLLPSHYGRPQVVDLLDGPAAALEEALSTHPDMTWSRIVDALGVRDGARVIRAGPKSLHMFEMVDPDAESNPLEPSHEIRRGEAFSLGFTLHFAGYHAILGQAHAAWIGMTFADGSQVAARGVGELVLPGLDEKGRELRLRERDETGKRRFVCLSSRIPYPRSLEECLRHGQVEKVALDRIAGFLHRQPASGRRLTLLDVVIVP